MVGAGASARGGHVHAVRHEEAAPAGERRGSHLGQQQHENGAVPPPPQK